ncbi:MAG: hypothetical protein QXO15_07125 [Nitrososphaerota archaeon]
MPSSKERVEFLLQMHKVYWDNISRSEDACWKMTATYSALIAGLSLSIETIGYIGFLGVLIPFSFMSIAISLNANLWFVRNIGLISNLEKEFLTNKDYNYLIPRKWGEERVSFVNSEPWWIFIIVYFAVCLIITAFIFQKLCPMEQIFIVSLFTTCLFLTIIYGKIMRSKYEEFKKDAPGRRLE